MSQLVWLITGCSSGFGEQFVHSILARGDKVIATARKIDKIQHLQQAGATILQLDITDKQQQIRDTIAAATRIHGKIDVLVNNAAYIAIGTWEDLEYVLCRVRDVPIAYLKATGTKTSLQNLIPMSSEQSR